LREENVKTLYDSVILILGTKYIARERGQLSLMWGHMIPTAADLEGLYGIRVREVRSLPDTSRAWLVEAEGDRLVLRIHGPERHAAHAGEMTVLRLCAEEGYLAPRLVPTAAGDVLFPWEGGEGYMTSWIEGDLPLGDLDDAHLMGLTTGRLHAISTDGRGLPMTTYSVRSGRREFHTYDADPSVRAWAGYADLREQLLSAWADLSDLDTVPQVIVHTDVLWENAIRTPQGQMVLIDWDDTGLGPAIQDVGYFLAHCTVLPHAHEEWATDIATAFLEGYKQARSLSAAEQDLLPDAMVFGVLSYVLAPWHGGIETLNWRRVRAILDHPEQIRAMIRG
jgi:Ser/Thr protein kinase RdoA (MazF antagonist)